MVCVACSSGTTSGNPAISESKEGSLEPSLTDFSWPEWEKYKTEKELYSYTVAQIKDISPEIKDFPEAKLVRWMKLGEWGQAQVDCMNGKGFKAHLNTGGIGYDSVPKDQGPALNLAGYECATSYPVDPRINFAKPKSWAKKEYDYLTSVTVPCIRGMGKQVKDPPSFERWFATNRTAERWDVYSEVFSLPLEESNPIYEKCPAFSADAYPSDLKGK